MEEIPAKCRLLFHEGAHCTEGIMNMQVQTCLELRLPAGDIVEEAFAHMASRLSSFGSAEETDAESGARVYIAWFPVEADSEAQHARIMAQAQHLGAMPEDMVLTLLGDDWETAWQKDWQGKAIGERLWVRPSFREPAPDGRIDIVLDPGMAFGTGQHATTCLCLRAIERACAGQPPVSLLDMGAGSGLLAIAAGKLGVRRIVAIDHDPVAVEAASVNADINGVALESRLGDTPPDAVFELVVANILAGPLVTMAPQLSVCTAHRLVLSGLLQTQVDEVRASYEAEGLSAERVDTEGEWASIELVR
jgi:ribosomal protein L11 methyltransferase